MRVRFGGSRASRWALASSLTSICKVSRDVALRARERDLIHPLIQGFELLVCHVHFVSLKSVFFFPNLPLPPLPPRLWGEICVAVWSLHLLRLCIGGVLVCWRKDGQSREPLEVAVVCRYLSVRDDDAGPARAAFACRARTGCDEGTRSRLFSRSTSNIKSVITLSHHSHIS